MFKFAAIVSLMLVATWSHADSRRHKKDASEPRDFDSGGTVWAAGLSCDSCGSECASACGTRHFRSCCFNYLRKKRTDVIEVSPQTLNDMKSFQELSRGERQKPVVIVQKIPEQWSNMISSENRPYDEIFENRFFDI